MRRHQPARLVIHKEPRALARRQWLAVDDDDIVLGDVERGRIDDAAVDGDAPLHDPFLSIAARGKSRPRQRLGDAFARFLDARGLRRAFFEFALALAVGAATAEGRTFGEDLAVVLVLPARPILTRIAARMLLPVVAGLAAALARTLEFRTLAKGAIALESFTLRTILARARKPRAVIAAL